VEAVAVKNCHVAMEVLHLPAIAAVQGSTKRVEMAETLNIYIQHREHSYAGICNCCAIISDIATGCDFDLPHRVR
jgi:hypothetical protein